LEGLVFGARAGEAAANDAGQRSLGSGQWPVVGGQPEKRKSPPRETQSAISTAVRKRVKRLMWERVGILRDRDSLRRALQELETIAAGNIGTSSRNFVTLAQLVARGAIWREESRGGHYRTDFPEQRDEFRLHSIQRIGAQISTAERISFDTGVAA
jgi:L-aspartate oxidase